MRSEFYFDSHGAGRIHCCRWMPEKEPKAVVQLVHGIAEFILRYDGFADYLASQGFLVVGEDHMGHGKSAEEGSVKGYFHGGWFTAVEDTYELMRRTMAEFPGVPYVLFGHSMGSFMARTILAKYPDSGISAAVICGTGWQPKLALPALVKMVEAVCKVTGEQKPSQLLQSMAFGGYNKRIEHPRTSCDWLTRDSKIVDEAEAYTLGVFTPSSGLMRDMMKGIHYIEQTENLNRMKKDLPVLFIAGGDDPVGNYGKGVHQAAEAFRKAGMERVSEKIYPLCRHEILNEINKTEIFEDVAQFIKQSALKD